MKHFIKFLLCTSLLIMAITFTSCQDEFEDVLETDEQETIVASSTTAKLVENTVSNDGSFDNIVDGASCFAVKFPYTVTVKGLDVTINSIQDLRVIEELFDAIDDDIDVLEFIFPITITLADFSEIVINGKEELREIAQKCKEGGGDDDIECIDFVYPVTLYTFDINKQQTGNVTVENDKQLRRFFAGLDKSDIISIDFPVELELFDGTKTTVNNNAELASAIERAKGVCDEDDDNDYNDDDFNKERLDNYLVKCPWLVREVKRNNQNQTDQYFEYVMNFTEDGAVKVRDRQGNTLTGTWSTRVSDFRVLLKLEFDVLVDFNLEWFIYEIEEGKIKLFADGGNKIIMKKACDLPDNTPDTLREVLKECSWIIKKVKLNNESINRLLGFAFEFKSDGVVTLSDGETTGTGTWGITTNQDGKLVMAITMGDEPGVSFEWLLSDLRNNRLKFNIEGTNYELLLERDCDNDVNDDDVVWIRGLFNNTNWEIALFSENEDETTTSYADYTFTFEEGRMIKILNGDNEEVDKGRWFVYRNSEGVLEVIITFRQESNFHPLANDYRVLEVEENRLALKHENDDNGYDRLVLETIQS